MLLLLGVVGLGWTASLLDSTWVGRLAVAPAVGLCALVLGGSFVGRVGLDLNGIAGTTLVVVLAAAGWIPFARRAARRRRAGHPPVSRRTPVAS